VDSWRGRQSSPRRSRSSRRRSRRCRSETLAPNLRSCQVHASRRAPCSWLQSPTNLLPLKRPSRRQAGASTALGPDRRSPDPGGVALHVLSHWTPTRWGRDGVKQSATAWKPAEANGRHRGRHRAEIPAIRALPGRRVETCGAPFAACRAEGRGFESARPCGGFLRPSAL
jgi:hypothetical protein